MIFGFSKSRLSPIAIDFGGDSLKLLQVIPTDPPQLVAAAAALVPEEARTDSNKRLKFLKDGLRRLLKKQPFKGRRAVLSIPAFQTLVQHLAIARGDQEDLKAQIDQQLRERLNIEPTRMVIRHFAVGQIVREGSTMEHVLCLAARRDAVMRYIDLAKGCKLNIVGMHSEPLAILKAFTHLSGESKEGQRGVCLIDMGARTTKVVIAHGTQLISAKTIHVGGDHITRQVAASHNLSFDQAQKARISAAGAEPRSVVEPASTEPATTVAGTGALGLALSKPDREAATESIASSDEPTGKARADTLDCIIDELQLCIRYHQSQFPKNGIEKLVFMGGESRDVTICQAIARAVRIAAQLGDPFARLSRIGHAKSAPGVDLNQPQPGWAVPMGLCLGEANL